MLDLLGLKPITVACDMEGPLPEALADALLAGPVAFVLQPTAQIPFGFTFGKARLEALAEVLVNAPDVKFVEDDWIGPIGSFSPSSQGAASSFD
ncbi:hypothetical protein [Billgrantia endophytica]|uniref:Uncharacterized protein n=1 Tax=Billgrantia endophytica TaxID=2033802 RepID=A0A2N7U7Y5_9GAMM|nr:hypothetical protein [Halomonas endophytica]PMR76537.1 hypothetical protein C1H69_05710 [Halomonas endophytica]